MGATRIDSKSANKKNIIVWFTLNFKKYKPANVYRLLILRVCLPILMLLAYCQKLTAQLCQGSLGDPVVNINFGSGPNPGPSLAAATTNYNFVSFDCPNDGSYTVTNRTNSCFGNSWHSLFSDHTHNPNGYFMLVNASFQPSDFYVDTVHGLCSNTTFEFAAWLLNILKPESCGSNGIRPNITFSIEKTDGTLLSKYNTGDIFSNNSPVWQQYGFFFTTPLNSNDVVLRMRNNAPGGCGNDLALDDITFRPCGPKVTASIKGADTATITNLCEGSTATPQFTANISTGYAHPAYQWQESKDNGTSWTDIPGATSALYTRPATAATGSYLYRLSLSEAGNINIAKCRVVSNNLTVNVNSNPITTASNNGPVCAGTGITLQATGGASYNWTGPGNFSASGATVAVNNITAAQAGTFKVTVTSNAGCSHNDSTIVLVYPKPIAKFSVSPLTCEAVKVDFTDHSTGTNSRILHWDWQFGDGNSAVTQNTSHSFALTGNYPVSLRVQDSTGCFSDTFRQSVFIHPLPQPDFILPEVCLADPFAQFTDSSTIAGNGKPFTYSWNFGDPSANAGNPNTSTQQNPKHSYTATGIYNVQLTVTSKDGCVQDTIKPFTVNGSLPKANFSIDNSSHCSNQPVTITNNSTVDFGSITKVEIYWDYTNDPTIKTTDENPVPGKAYHFQYADFGSPLTKTFTINYVAYSGISCVSQTTQTVTINASPLVQFNALAPVCSNASPYLFTQASETTGLNGTGIYSGTGISANGQFDPSLATAGLNTITYTYTASNGCSNAQSQTIQVNPQPAVSAGLDKTILEGGSAILDGSGSGNSISYTWSPLIAIDSIHIPHPRVNPLNDIIYTLTVSSADGCINSDDVLVKVLKTPIIPNVFSPNGDGINDTWVIQYLDSYPGADVAVYNRWGQQVFHAVGYNKPWNGTYNGSALPVGTYYYVIDRKVKAARLSGSVTLLK